MGSKAKALPMSESPSVPPTSASTSSPIDVLVTGGTGLIGRWLLARLTAQGHRVAALVRGGEKRRRELVDFLLSHGGKPENLHLFDGDLSADGPLFGDDGCVGVHEEALFAEVRVVYHLAAAFAFGMKAERARRINVDGTLKVAAFATALPQLQRFVALGGYRATRLPPWLEESPVPLPAPVRKRLYRHHGAYEASKLEAHLELGAFAKRHGLPLTNVHPCTVIGSSQTGETNQRVGLGDMAERLFEGELPALVGTAETYLPIVCVDYLADLLARVPMNAATLGQDLCVLDETTPNLPELIQEMAAHLGVKAPTRLVPKGLVAALPEALTGVEKETLTFLSEDRYDTASAQAHANAVGLLMPDRTQALHRWLDHLVATDFLRGPSTGGRFESIAGAQTYLEGDVDSRTLFLHGLPWDGESGVPLEQAAQQQASLNRNASDHASLEQTARNHASPPFAGMLRPDLPGLGRSSGSLDDLDEWLEQLCSRRGSVSIVAHSLSTTAALRFACRHPDKVAELVLISPFFLQKPAPRWQRCAPLVAKLLPLGSPEDFGQRLVRPDAVKLPAIASAHRSLRRRGVASAVASALAKASQPAQRSEAANLLAQVRVPCCIVHGSGDPLVVEAPAAMPVFCIEGAGHNPHVEMANEVVAVIRRWREGR